MATETVETTNTATSIILSSDILSYISALANIMTIIASGLAIYIFITKRKTISSLFGLLLNYSFQLSLSEIKEKLEKLNDYNAKDPDQLDNIVNLMSEIIGQIQGNPRLKLHFSQNVRDLDKLIDGSSAGKITEARKRRIISELREKLRHLNISNIDNLIGEQNE